MKTLIFFALGVAAISSATLMAPAQAAPNEPTLQRMQDCFKAHSQLMERPAVRTLQDCWNAHQYLMTYSRQS